MAIKTSNIFLEKNHNFSITPNGNRGLFEFFQDFFFLNNNNNKFF